MFNLTTEYVFKLLRVFAWCPECNVTARDAVDRARVPVAFGIQIVKNLVRAGILKSQKGPGGGCRLPDSNRKMTLESVMSRYGISKWDIPELGAATKDLKIVFSAFREWTQTKTISSLTDDRVFDQT